ncbi:MAG: choice-of-anchor D domain-containing protein, partial [Saprospiraceae bacterium]
MASSGFGSPNSLLAFFRNTNSAELTTLTISYSVEQYRVNTAAASIQFFYSLNGSTWTAVPLGDVAASSLPTGASAYSFPPALTVNVAAFNITSLGITQNSDIYLRWNINTTGSNSQGLGIDNVSVTATFAGVSDINIQSPVGVNAACGVATAAFGNVGVGSTGTATVRIENLGTIDLNLTGLPLTITGANANQFSITTQPSTPIAAGSFSDMELQFVPTSTGAKTATISISSNDVNESPCSIAITGTAIAQSLYFRSKNSGDWTDVNTWETSLNGSGWSNATVAPVNFASDLTVTIQSGHVVNILDDLTVDELVVAAGATLTASSITKLNFNNGAGVDFDLQGTFEDNAGSANTATFVSGAKWQMGGTAIFLKTSDSGIAIYRDNYQGGISTIPASANWIVRLSTNIDLAAIGMFYPNLSLESVSGAVDMGMAGSTGGFCTIKGNLDVGVNGAGTVRLNNANFNATACQVLGNLTIGDRSEMRNTNTGGTTFGTGFDLFG